MGEHSAMPALLGLEGLKLPEINGGLQDNSWAIQSLCGVLSPRTILRAEYAMKSFAGHFKTIGLVALAGVSLSACAYDDYGYGGVSVGYGGGGYYDDYYPGYGGYPGYGWYDGFYYPGNGYYVYDRGGRRHRWNDGQRRYWEGRRGDRPGAGRPGNGRPGDGRPGYGRPGDGRPGDGRGPDRDGNWGNRDPNRPPGNGNWNGQRPPQGGDRGPGRWRGNDGARPQPQPGIRPPQQARPQQQPRQQMSQPRADRPMRAPSRGGAMPRTRDN